MAVELLANFNNEAMEGRSVAMVDESILTQAHSDGVTPIFKRADVVKDLT